MKRIERVSAADLPGLLDRDGSVQLLDVREEKEWRDSHIPGSTHLPYHDIHDWPDGLDVAQPVAAICASGQRSGVAASLLQRYGGERVLHVVDGGVGTWERAGNPVERGA